MVAIDDRLNRRVLAAVQALARVAEVRAAYLFGSHVKGTSDRWSDIDIAAFMDAAETWDSFHRAKVIVGIQKEVGFDIEPHIFPSTSLEHAASGSFAEEIIRHGVRIL